MVVKLYVKFLYIEVICCQRVVTAGRKGKQRIASDDVFTTESQDEMMADAQALDSEQWSLFEVLTPLGEKIIQDPVSLPLYV